MNIEHGKRITTESYYDSSLASVKQEVEVSLFTSKETLLKDIIDALAVISSGETHKLDIVVQIDSQNRIRIIKKWLLK